MATSATANYGLNLWEAGDPFSREEFNENSQKIDLAYGPSNLPWTVGTYVGTGTAAGQSQNINLGYRPSLLIIVGNDTFGLAAFTRGYTVRTSVVNFENNTNLSSAELTLTTTGFTVTRASMTGPSLDKLNSRFIYFALR